MRDGLWVVSDDAACKFDERLPITKWPFCANFVVIRGDKFLSPSFVETDDGKRKVRGEYSWESTKHLIADGDPLIDQSQDCNIIVDEPAEAVASVQPVDAEPPVEAPPVANTFCYIAARPLAFDDGHKVVALKVWPVLCESNDSTHSRNRRSTNSPLVQGLTREGRDCIAQDREVLRRVALENELGAKGRNYHWPTMHWVRDGLS